LRRDISGCPQPVNPVPGIARSPDKPQPGKVGPGAVALIGRYNPLNIGHQVFTSGLADPNLWTNQLYTVDLGVNWYWTQYIKVYIGWQHAGFGNPVLYAPNRWQLTSDQFWLRFQLFF
jgi:phosphate-selective porin OprO/OprP